MAAGINAVEWTQRVVLLRQESCASAAAELQKWEEAKATHEQNQPEAAFVNQAELDAALKKLQKELTEFHKAQQLATNTLPGIKLPMNDPDKPTLSLDKGLTEKKARDFFTKVRAWVLKHGGGEQDPEAILFGQRSVCIAATKMCISNFSDLTKTQLDFFNGRDCEKWSVFQREFVQFFAGVKTTAFDAGDEFLKFRQQNGQSVDAFNAEHKRLFMRTLDESSEEQYEWQTANSSHRLQYMRSLNSDVRALVIDDQETSKQLAKTKSMSQLMEAVASSARAEEGRKQLHQQGNSKISWQEERSSRKEKLQRSTPTEKPVCARCGRLHKGQCHAITHKNGHTLNSKDPSAKVMSPKPVFVDCTRCGRSHVGGALSCWSTEDKNGLELSSAPTAYCPMRCSSCGQKGKEPASHLRANCPKGANMKRVRQLAFTIDNKSPSKKKKPSCFNCGGTGHSQHQCPSAAAEENGSASE
jgi:hypothetical protein